MDEEITKTNSRIIWNFVILVSLVMMLIFIYLVISEINAARKSCEDIKGTYKLSKFEHTCNNESFYKYTDGTWNYKQKPINLSNILN